jgi:hypothetical protein
MTIQSITCFYVSMNRQFFMELLPFSTYSSNSLYAQLLHFIWEFLKTLYVCLLLYGDLYIVVTVWWWAVVEKVIVLPLLDLEYYMKSKKSNCNSSQHWQRSANCTGHFRCEYNYSNLFIYLLNMYYLYLCICTSAKCMSVELKVYLFIWSHNFRFSMSLSLSPNYKPEGRWRKLPLNPGRFSPIPVCPGSFCAHLLIVL